VATDIHLDHENEAEELKVQAGLLVPSSDEDEIQKMEQQVIHAEFNQHKILGLHIPAVTQEQFD
jgi:hypothetical protein